MQKLSAKHAAQLFSLYWDHSALAAFNETVVLGTCAPLAMLAEAPPVHKT